MQSTSCERPCWMNHKLELEAITMGDCDWEKYQQFRYTDDTTLMAESEEELKSLLMKVKEHSVKTGLKHYIQKTTIIVYSPITSGQIDGGKMGAVTVLIFLGSKITVDGDCSHEIEILAPWKERYDKSKQCI